MPTSYSIPNESGLGAETKTNISKRCPTNANVPQYRNHWWCLSSGPKGIEIVFLISSFEFFSTITFKLTVPDSLPYSFIISPNLLKSGEGKCRHPAVKLLCPLNGAMYERKKKHLMDAYYFTYGILFRPKSLRRIGFGP